jgi:hypothetical protein
MYVGHPRNVPNDVPVVVGTSVVVYYAVLLPVCNISLSCSFCIGGT